MRYVVEGSLFSFIEGEIVYICDLDILFLGFLVRRNLFIRVKEIIIECLLCIVCDDKILGGEFIN